MVNYENFGRSISIYRLIAIISLIFSTALGTDGGKCSKIKMTVTPAGDSKYLTDILESLSSKQYKSSDGKYSMSVCEKVIDPKVSDAKAGMISTEKSAVIGKFDDITAMTIDESSKVVYYRFGGGNACKSGSSSQAEITVVCDSVVESLVFTGDESNCRYTFILTSKSTCDIVRPKAAPPTAAPAVPAPAAPTAAPVAALTKPPSTTTTTAAPVKSSSHMSAFTGFILFLLALGFGYCVVGFLYKRYVLGARGAQQIPNYLFWIRITQSVQDCVSNRSTSSSSNRYATSSSRSAEYDRANASDEQLMNDGNDEFRYDQPPLTVGPGAGQASTFRQQQLNAAPTTPSVNAQRQHQQQEPLLLPPDDADERLLQV